MFALKNIIVIFQCNRKKNMNIDIYIGTVLAFNDIRLLNLSYPKKY